MSFTVVHDLSQSLKPSVGLHVTPELLILALAGGERRQVSPKLHFKVLQSSKITQAAVRSIVFLTSRPAESHTFC